MALVVKVVVQGLCLSCRRHDSSLTRLASPPPSETKTRRDEGRKDATACPMQMPSSLTPSLPPHPHIHLTEGSTEAAAMVNSNEIACVSPLCNLGECHGGGGREGDGGEGRRGLCVRKGAAWHEGRVGEREDDMWSRTWTREEDAACGLWFEPWVVLLLSHSCKDGMMMMLAARATDGRGPGQY